MQVPEAARQLFTLYAKACDQYLQHANYPAALVNISEQMLYIFADTECIGKYPVSTSRFGAGEKENSYKTPRGVHCVAEKIGADAGFSEIFKARKRTHTTARIEFEKTGTGEDYITSRILWLTGLEEGVNKGAGVDSHGRYIYIHGTHAEGLIGQPASEGCIRMKNQDVMDLFDRLEVSSLVIINA